MSDPSAPPLSAAAAADACADGAEPQPKRQRIEPATAADTTAAAPPTDEEDPAAADKLSQALNKISGHISNPSKFVKASGLLRQLLDGGKIDKGHRREYFTAVKAAFQDPDNTANPQLMKEYKRLFTAVSEHVDVLGRAERAQLEVYSIWTMLRSQLFTDDSFSFNKVVSQIKTAINELPDADDKQQHAADVLTGQATAEAPAAAATPPAAPAAVADESDPFGLDRFLQAEQPAPPPAVAHVQHQAADEAKQQPLAWSPAEQLVMRKQALLDCLLAAKQQHRLAWAHTSVELLISHAHQQRAKFVTHQQQQLDELMKFVRAQQLARKTGRAGGARGSDMTSFEKARAEWGGAVVSARGKVGSQGDARASHWLG